MEGLSVAEAQYGVTLYYDDVASNKDRFYHELCPKVGDGPEGRHIMALLKRRANGGAILGHSSVGIMLSRAA